MDTIERLKDKAIKKNGLSAAEALDLFIEGTDRTFRVMAAATEIREHFKGKDIILCGITNAKSGKCPENCSFCAQSANYETEASTYPLQKATRIIAEAAVAARNGAEFFGIVTSGKTIKTKKEWSEIFKAIDGV
ncbi:MAG: biotin synthase BioB, partial [Smithella sp.]